MDFLLNILLQDKSELQKLQISHMKNDSLCKKTGHPKTAC